MYYVRDIQRRKFMKPRIFVSSTFYDLKAIREDLYHFIRQYNYDPIESETGDIGYVPGEELDESCYKAMKDSDMAILIIGGRYGSPTSDVKEDGDYLSVTHKEFRTAVNNGIPVYAFIEQAVATEYELYKKNRKRFDDPKFEFEFSSVDDINVFKFISELKSISGIPTVEFKKTQDIKEFLTIQWASMLKNYLTSLRKNLSNKKMTDSVEEMKILMGKMDVMLETVGKKILSVDNSDEYQNVVEKQKIIEVSKRIIQIIKLEDFWIWDSDDEKKDNITELLDALDESIKIDMWSKLDTRNSKEFFEFFKKRGLSVKSVTIGGDKYLATLSLILGNPKSKEILISELMRDDNYSELIYDGWDDWDEPDEIA